MRIAVILFVLYTAMHTECSNIPERLVNLDGKPVNIRGIVTVYEGDPWTLSCLAPEYDLAEWLKIDQDHVIEGLANGEISVKRSAVNFRTTTKIRTTLQKEKASSTDEGVYICHYNATEATRLIVKERFARRLRGLPGHRVRPGEFWSIVCEHSYTRTRTFWKKDNITIGRQRGQRSLIQKTLIEGIYMIPLGELSSMLFSNNADISHQGNYRCTHDDECSTCEKKTLKKPHYQLFVDNGLHEAKFVGNRSLVMKDRNDHYHEWSITCESSSPMTEFSWKKNNMLIRQLATGDFQVRTKGNRSTISSRYSREQYSGNYTCTPNSTYHFHLSITIKDDRREN